MDTTKVKASPDTISCVFNNKPPPAGDLKEIVPVVITVVTLTLMRYLIKRRTRSSGLTQRTSVSSALVSRVVNLVGHTVWTCALLCFDFVG